ncbi:MAG: type II toxin-antitoxin system RelE/ParE family toxin [Atopobiaceae bacterium]|nr:type II toxin-antitoxin system RelE/ParE family toxin [Atopobiaceae bacterium]
MRHHMRMQYSDQFLSQMDEVQSDDTVEHVGRIIGQLQAFPDMGNPRPRQTLRNRYGEDIRTMPVEHYLLVYKHDEVLKIIALVWATSIK